MQDLNITISAISLILLLVGAIYAKLQRMPLSEPLVATVAGLLLGPHVLNVLDMNVRGEENQIMLIATRFTIAMALMATALRLPPIFITRHRRNQFIVVVLGMLTMWLHSTILFWLIFSLDFTLAALAGAIITPTDPVIASSIVSGGFARKHLPEKIRNTLSFESGANDGLAFPLVMLPLLLLSPGDHSVSEWLLSSVLWESVGGIVLGALVGYGAGRLVNTAQQRKLMTEKSLLASSIALSFLIIGSFQLIQVNSIIAVFAAGLLFNHCISKNDDLKDEKIQEVLERIFVTPIFFLFGLILPLSLWAQEGWLLLALVGGVLLLRRLPSFLLFGKLLKGYHYPDLLVMGWLGPIGVSSMFYAFHADSQLDNNFLWVATSAVIFGSTLVHGITSSLTAQWYKRRTSASEEKKIREET